MAKQITPRYYPARKCFRVRKKIGGKTQTFYGGHAAAGPHDEDAKARARLEIKDQIVAMMWGKIRTIEAEEAKSQAHGEWVKQVDSLDQDIDGMYQDYLDNQGDTTKTEGSAILGKLVSIEQENSSLRSQIAAMSSVPLAADVKLEDIQETYAQRMREQGKAEGKHASTINEYARASRLLVVHLAEYQITTTAQLEKASAVIAQYRDEWINKISNNDCSKSVARRMLLGARQFVEWMLSREYISRMPPAITRQWTAVGTDEASPTYLTPKECRKLFKHADDRIKLAIALGLNCGYRQSDMRSLKRADIDLQAGTIKRQRHKTGKAQAHKLWPVTLQLLKDHLAKTQGDPFAQGWSNISKELTAYMLSQVSQEPHQRSAKSLRSTGAQELEKLLEGKQPRVVQQYLGHADKAIAKHYRDEDTRPLFEALDRLGQIFALKK